MNNVLLLHDNQVDRAVIAASSEVATMPVINLQDPQRTIMYRTSANGNQTIDITLASDEEQVQAFALVDHNLTLGGTVQVEAWSDALGGANQILNTTLQPYQPTYGYGSQLYGEGLYGGYDIYISGLSISDARDVLRPILMSQLSSIPNGTKYWRITLNDPGVTYYQAGRLYLGPAWSPSVNFSFGGTKTRQNRTRRRESRGGQNYGNPRTDRTILQFSLDWLDDADRDRLWITHMMLGKTTPFILVQRPVGGYEQESTTFYGVFDQLTMRQAFSGNATVPVTFNEEL